MKSKHRNLNLILPPFLIAITCICLMADAKEFSEFRPSNFSSNGKVVLVGWDSHEGKKRLATTEFSQDFYQLAHNFQPQINPLYCGIATTTIILNSLRIPEGRVPSLATSEIQRPEVWGGGKIPFPSYSQSTLLNERTDQVKPRELINLTNITPENSHDSSQFDPGLTLSQLRGIQETYDLKVEMYYADQNSRIGTEKFRRAIKATLSEKRRFLVVNFVGNTIGTLTGGHISPVAAYHEETDSILILDVASHKNPWYWVPVSHMYKSMHTKDGPNYRGWLIISDQQ